MAESTDLDALESRLKKLELQVFGNSPANEQHPELLPKLYEVASKFNDAVTPRSKLTSAMEKLPELEQCLDASYGLACDDGALAEVLLAQEDTWRRRLGALEKIADMKEVLDSEPIVAVAGSAREMAAVTVAGNELTALGSEQAQRVTALLSGYNQILNTLSATFAQMDDVITRAEQAA